ncbi:MAG: hypothetical protein JW936_02815 [Sedimentisphaerales bacterium]|nr:hypothetical protein [Sedimentisphaerales bacterium]
MFQQRLKILFIIIGLTMAMLVARLAWLQIHCADKYNTYVQEFLDRPGRLLETVRGTIYDCNLKPIALDRPAFDLCLHYDITRIYDPRFWDIQAIRFFSGENQTGLPHNQARSYLARRFHLNDAEISSIIQNHSVNNRIPLAAIRQVLLEKANSLITELAQACRIPVEQLLEPIDQINNRVYDRRLARARRVYYDNHPDITYTPAANIAELTADFQRLIPDPQQQLYLISQCDILEMHQPHTALHDISSFIALDIEAGFVGSFLASDTNRPITIRSTTSREFPYNDIACHIIGQLGPTSPDPCAETLDDPPTPQQLYAYRNDDRQGSWGIEAAFEPYLRGQRGYVRYDIDHQIVERIDPLPGQDVYLTIDIELQRAIQNLFETQGQIGAAVVIDVPTAEVRAAVSIPTFDLNTYYQTENYHLITLQMPNLYWVNRAFDLPYQPGSTSKPSLLLAGLELGIVNENTTFFCPPRDDSKPPPQCWSPNGHRDIALHRAIRESCNTYFIRIAELADNQQLLEFYNRLGFGRRILAWPNSQIAQAAENALDETAGHLPPPSLSEFRFLGIGRGGFDASVLQMANSMATIARDGVFVPPTLVRMPAAQQPPDRVASRPHDIQLIQDAMQAVIYHPRGTGYDAFNPIPWTTDQLTLFGKTGSTANALFTCFARTPDNRAIALAVLIQTENLPEAAHGGTTAAPVARDILLILANHGYLPQPAYPQ